MLNNQTQLKQQNERIGNSRKESLRDMRRGGWLELFNYFIIHSQNHQVFILSNLVFL